LEWTSSSLLMREKMMRIIGLSCIIALGFASFAAICRECGSSRSSTITMKEQQTTNKPQTTPDQATEFNELTSVKGTTKDGAPYSAQIFESPDGVRVSVTRENRDSPARADKELHRRIEKALEIIDRGTKVDQKGHTSGQRVVARFAKSGSSESEAAILWTDGSQLYSIASSSLTVALEFEKKFYR